MAFGKELLVQFIETFHFEGSVATSQRFVIAAGDENVVWLHNFHYKERQQTFQGIVATIDNVAIENELFIASWPSILLEYPDQILELSVNISDDKQIFPVGNLQIYNRRILIEFNCGVLENLKRQRRDKQNRTDPEIDQSLTWLALALVSRILD